MSSQKYFGLVTDKGLAKLRAAAQGTAPLMLSHMAFGDGNGAETAPTGSMNALVNERYRAPLSDKRPHETNPSILYVEAIIPPGVGGWTLREAGIYDSDGDLIVIAKTPVMDVALLAEGATTEGLVRLPIVFESTQSAQFLIDPTVLLATQSWVIDRIISRPFITVESVTLKTPPTNPTAFSLYVVPAGATGAWANKTGQMAHWHGAWQFANAPIAKVVGASDTGKYWRRTATGWAEFAASETEAGLLRLASDAEHKAGMSRTLAAHPAGVAANVQNGKWKYAIAGGTARALEATLEPVLAELSNSIQIVITPTIAPEAGATLNVNSLGARPILGPDGQGIRPGDMQADVPAVLQYSTTVGGGSWLLLTSSRIVGQTVGFKAQRVTGTLPTGSFVTPIFLDKIFDTNNGYNATTGKYTISKSGVYSVSANFYISSSPDVTVPTLLMIVKNGVAEAESSVHTAPRVLTVSSLIKCAVGDTISVWVKIYSGAAVTLPPNSIQCCFSASFIGSI